MSRVPLLGASPSSALPRRRSPLTRALLNRNGSAVAHYAERACYFEGTACPSGAAFSIASKSSAGDRASPWSPGCGGFSSIGFAPSARIAFGLMVGFLARIAASYWLNASTPVEVAGTSAATAALTGATSVATTCDDLSGDSNEAVAARESISAGQRGIDFKGSTWEADRKSSSRTARAGGRGAGAVASVRCDGEAAWVLAVRFACVSNSIVRPP
jgi:hypothetical protein